MLQKKVIKRLQWYDTRDMIADGHTKGNIDRTALINAMNGEQKYLYETRTHEPV